MKINIRGQKMEITKSIKEHIENKMLKLEKHFNKPDEIVINILVKVKGINQSIEVTIPYGKLTIRAEESHSDLYAAIDLVVDKLDNQIRKNKNRIKKRSNAENDEIEFTFSFPDDQPEIENGNNIVKRKSIELKPMDEEEAILQMELLNHDFF